MPFGEVFFRAIQIMKIELARFVQVYFTRWQVKLFSFSYFLTFHSFLGDLYHMKINYQKSSNFNSNDCIKLINATRPKKEKKIWRKMCFCIFIETISYE